MGNLDIVRGIVVLVPLILSLAIHEWAHAYSAWKLGDDTAARMGRLTLNPMAHVDPFGTLLLPFLLASQGLPTFGWARPVPVDPTRFRRDVTMGKGMAITASAGPVSNVVLAVLSTVALGLLYRFGGEPSGWSRSAAAFLSDVILLNVALAVFNLIPLPPLDGSRIVAWLMPHRLRDQWHAVERFAPILLLAVFVLGGRIIAGPAGALVGLLEHLLNLIA